MWRHTPVLIISLLLSPTHTQPFQDNSNCSDVTVHISHTKHLTEHIYYLSFIPFSKPPTSTTALSMNNNCQRKLTDVWHSLCIYSCLGRGAVFYHLDYEREEGPHTSQRYPSRCRADEIESLLCLLNVTDVDSGLSSCGSNWIERRKLQ